MFNRPDFLIIGAAGRNVGKTEFACALIRRYAGEQPVTGIKITTVHERDGVCPRGGEGCGVCSALKENYAITHETEGPEEKDTIRMLRAGAQNVYWLRVLKEHLAEGVQALLRKIPENACVICESNSARTVIDPGLFLVVKESASTQIKSSCLNVLDEADKLIGFDGTGWDFQPKEIRFEQQTWKIKS